MTLVHGDLLGIEDAASDLPDLLAVAARLKAEHRAGAGESLLAGKSAILLFEKSSTRTRVSLEIGLAKLGMKTVVLNVRDMQLGRGETVEDTALVLARYADCIFHRALSASTVRELAEHAAIPVVNALDDVEHPLQILADLLTLREHFGALEGLTVAWVGDGNNVARSLALGAALCGMHVRLASPAGFELDEATIERASVHAATRGGSVTTHPTPQDAVEGANVVVTDTWVSMGDEEDEARRLAAFDGWTVDEALMANAAPGARFLHCLPAHYGHEVTKSVAHGPASLVFDEAENRMWTSMAVAVWLLAPEAFRRLAAPAPRALARLRHNKA